MRLTALSAYLYCVDKVSACVFQTFSGSALECIPVLIAEYLQICLCWRATVSSEL